MVSLYSAPDSAIAETEVDNTVPRLQDSESLFYSDTSPPISRYFAGLSITQPPAVYTTSDSSILVDPESSVCRHLISHTFSSHEIIPLIEVIFTSEAEIDVVRDLRGDEAQTFIDVVHGVRPHIPSFPRHVLIASSSSAPSLLISRSLPIRF